MGIELPRELADVAAATGLSWPQADEDELHAQATAWRGAQNELTALAAEADRTASAAAGALTGPSADAAREMWAGFVDPDRGHLTLAAKGAGEAADRLTHAAEQVAAAKVEMVRQLVDAAKNRDAASAAAEAGHPTALLGLAPVLKGTAANLAILTTNVETAVGPGGGAGSPGGPGSAEAGRGGVLGSAFGAVDGLVSGARGAATTGGLLDVNPGTHTPEGQSGLLSAVTGLPSHVLSAVDSPLPEAPLLRPVDDRPMPPVEPSTGLDHPVPGLGTDLDHPVSSLEPGASEGGPVPSAVPEPGTGPIRTGHYSGFLAHGGFDDVPTPPAGIPGGTVAAGFAEGAPASLPSPGPDLNTAPTPR
ncbi:hypothetical protein FNH07_28940, partial [Amycolatopsis bartoniae]